MLACIACSKQLDDGGDDSTTRAATPSTKDAVKSLTSQIKDLVLKFSGSHRQSKAGSSSTSYRSKSVLHRAPYHRYLDDGTSDAGQYTYLRSSSTTPAWDFTSVSDETESESRHKPVPILANGVAPEEGVVLEEDNSEPIEWMAQVEPGVHITFVSLPGGAGNDLKRIRFSREMFNKWQAQRWWGENYDRIMELYNVQRFSSQALPTPPRSEDGELQRDSCYSRVGSTKDSPITPSRNKDPFFLDTTSTRQQTTISRRGAYFPSVPDPTEHIFQNHHFHLVAPVGGGVSGIKGEGASIDASRTTTSSRDEASISISNASDVEVTEWVEQDEPGVYITIRELPDGNKELRRVRFSELSFKDPQKADLCIRERFGEVRAKLWWEENRERIQAQYL